MAQAIRRLCLRTLAALLRLLTRAPGPGWVRSRRRFGELSGK